MPLRDPQVGQAIRRLVELGLTQGEEMTEQEELIQNIRERLGEMPRTQPIRKAAFNMWLELTHITRSSISINM
jgi:hypothetical protein